MKIKIKNVKLRPVAVNAYIGSDLAGSYAAAVLQYPAFQWSAIEARSTRMRDNLVARSDRRLGSVLLGQKDG
jgi:hypothetical protein